MKAYMVKRVDRPVGCSVVARSEAEAIRLSEHWLGKGMKTAKLIFPTPVVAPSTRKDGGR